MVHLSRRWYLLYHSTSQHFYTIKLQFYLKPEDGKKEQWHGRKAVLPFNEYFLYLRAGQWFIWGRTKRGICDISLRPCRWWSGEVIPL